MKMYCVFKNQLVHLSLVGSTRTSSNTLKFTLCRESDSNVAFMAGNWATVLSVYTPTFVALILFRSCPTSCVTPGPYRILEQAICKAISILDVSRFGLCIFSLKLHNWSTPPRLFHKYMPLEWKNLIFNSFFRLSASYLESIFFGGWLSRKSVRASQNRWKCLRMSGASASTVKLNNRYERCK